MEKDELKIFKQAIVGEIEGYEFYKMASEQSTLEETKEAFLNLAAEELKHIEWLKSAYHSLRENPAEAFKLSIMDEVPTPNIFNWKNLDRTGAQKALSVFGIAIQMERTAVEFYKNASEKSTTEDAKQMFLKLSNWEKIHLEQFSKEYESLLQDWWDEQEFSPY